METEATIGEQKQTRAAYTLAEFAALFGHEQTWAYRMKYRGKIKVLPSQEFLDGGDMVPHSEVERLLSKATTYSDAIAGARVPPKKKRAARWKAKRTRIGPASKQKQKSKRRVK